MNKSGVPLRRKGGLTLGRKPTMSSMKDEETGQYGGCFREGGQVKTSPKGDDILSEIWKIRNNKIWGESFPSRGNGQC